MKFLKFTLFLFSIIISTSVFAQDVADRYDVMKYLDGSGKDGKKDADKGGNDALILILILVICGGLGFGIYKARETAK